MAFAIRGKQFQFEACLSQRPHSRVYLATNEMNDRIVVKFLLEPTLFFEELACHFACDDSPHLSEVIHNYPPYCISKQTFCYSQDILTLFGEEDLVGADGQLDEAAMAVSKLACVGVLILKYVEGRPLLDAFQLLDDAGKLVHLRSLARAIRDIHDHGEFHGDLCRENVLLEAGSGFIKLVGLGHFHKHDEEGWPVDRRDLGVQMTPADDIAALAANFMTSIEEPNEKLKDLIKKCTVTKAEKRPDIRYVCDTLHHLNLDPEPGAVRAPGLSSMPLFLRWVLVTSIVFTSFVGITWVTRNPLFEARDAILSDAETNPRAAIQDLQALRNTSLIDSDWHQLLARDISNIKKSGKDFKLLHFAKEDTTRPIAVFAFHRNPVLVGEKDVFQLGDWVQLPQGEGYISGINSRQIIVVSDAGPVVYNFHKPEFYVGHSMDEACAIIWKREDNLPRLIEALHQIQSVMREASVISRDTPLGTVFRTQNSQIRVGSCAVYGSYDAQTLNQFLDRMEPQLSIHYNGSDLEVYAPADRLPIYLAYGQISTANHTVESFCQSLGDDLGLKIEVPESLRSHPLPKKVFHNKKWQDVLDTLGFQWEAKIKGDRPMIFVQGVAM